MASSRFTHVMVQDVIHSVRSEPPLPERDITPLVAALAAGVIDERDIPRRTRKALYALMKKHGIRRPAAAPPAD